MFKKNLTKLALVLVIPALMGLAACNNKKATADTPTAGETQASTGDTQEVTPPAGDAEKEAFTAEDIHFDFDKSNVTPESAEILKKKAAYMGANAAVNATIEGHCDERGTAQYNMALGDRRAQAAKKYMVELGVADGRLATVSFGKEKPLVAGAKSEEDHAKNRRAHFEPK